MRERGCCILIVHEEKAAMRETSTALSKRLELSALRETARKRRRRGRGTRTEDSVRRKMEIPHQSIRCKKRRKRRQTKSISSSKHMNKTKQKKERRKSGAFCTCVARELCTYFWGAAWYPEIAFFMMFCSYGDPLTTPMTCATHHE